MGVPRISKVHQRIKNGGRIVLPATKQHTTKSDVYPDDKGKYLGSCNRSACLRPGARWWNRSTLAYYCTKCAYDINLCCQYDDFCKDAPLLEHDVHGPDIIWDIEEYEQQLIIERGWKGSSHY